MELLAVVASILPEPSAELSALVQAPVRRTGQSTAPGPVQRHVTRRRDGVRSHRSARFQRTTHVASRPGAGVRPFTPGHHSTSRAHVKNPS